MVDRKLLERLMSPSPKSQVMFASAFSGIGDFFEFLDSYFSSYGEFGEFSLTFTAAMNGRSAVAVCQKKRLITFNVAVVDFGPAWHC